MKLLKPLKTFLVVTSILIGTSVIAQEHSETPNNMEISDTELAQFASAYKEIQVVTAKAQEEVSKKVQENGFEIERFNTLYVASQNPENKLDATKEEVEKLKVVMTEITKMQPVYQQQMETAIAKEKLSVERYQQVATAIQNDTELQQRLQAKLQ